MGYADLVPRLQALPEEKRAEVLDFLAFVEQRNQAATKRVGFSGLRRATQSSCHKACHDIGRNIVGRASKESHPNTQLRATQQGRSQ